MKMALKKLAYMFRRQLHSHSWDKELQMAGYNYYPFDNVTIRVCNCGKVKYECQ